MWLVLCDRKGPSGGLEGLLYFIQGRRLPQKC